MVFSLSPRLILWTGLASMAVFVGTLAVIRQPAVHGAVNWMRSRGNHPPLQVP